MSMPIVRLEQIAIKHIKNVEYGKIKFENHKNKYPASILGLYGQNGSGKTTLIDVLYILKQLLMGQRLPDDIVDYINLNYDTAELSFEFSITTNTLIEAIYYDVTLGRQKVISDNSLEAMERASDSVHVVKERLQYKSNAGLTRKHTIIDTDTDDVFKPKAKFNLLFGENYGGITDFLVDKKLTKADSRSFIFSPAFIRRLGAIDATDASRDGGTYIMDTIANLIHYSHYDLHVVSTQHIGLNSLNVLPLEINVRDRGIGGVGTITVPLNDSVVLPEFMAEVIDSNIEKMNFVLAEMVPGLTIAKKELGTEILKDGDVGRRFILVSNKNDKSIPLKYESEGIRKIISVLSLLVAVYNWKSITVAIDELDGGIFEYLLGEILRIIAEHGKGQLIFTSHNLRPLETLDKTSVAFTTTNPKNRYIRLMNVKSTNNLRDVYYSDINLGGQSEETYKPTSNAEISYAFKKAGSVNWGERKRK